MDSRLDLYKILVSKYGAVIDGFKDGLSLIAYDDNGEKCKRNLETIRQKLELFCAMGYERKTKKWKGLNGVLKWIADKSVDVGIALLPLVIEAVQKIPV